MIRGPDLVIVTMDKRELEASIAAAETRGATVERERLWRALSPWLQKYRERIGSAAIQELADALKNSEP